VGASALAFLRLVGALHEATWSAHRMRARADRIANRAACPLTARCTATHSLSTTRQNGMQTPTPTFPRDLRVAPGTPPTRLRAHAMFASPGRSGPLVPSSCLLPPTRGGRSARPCPTTSTYPAGASSATSSGAQFRTRRGISGWSR
jgi:hypothetical protein